MEHLQSSPIIDQMRVRGQYDICPTDTAQLAKELSTSQNLALLVVDFDKGITPLRDVGGMITAQRTAILESYQAGTLSDMVASCPEAFSAPVRNLHERVVSGYQDQPIGHNFFVNATGFLDARFPWARQFDELVRARSSASIYDIARFDDRLDKDRLLAKITDHLDTEAMTTLAVYLAGRSLAGEEYLEKHYGESLKQAKEQVVATTQSIAATTGLHIDMINRVAEQLHCTTFGSFDHLNGLVTSDDSGAAGDYHIGSLRIEVQFAGSVQSPGLREDRDAYHVITHELHHAGSAQTRENYRCGLQIQGQGIEANEGMTEYLAQLSIGAPGIERLTSGGLRVRQDVPYRAAVFAMLALHEQFTAGKNQYFAILFNAYHGDVRDQAQLEQALDEFYRYDTVISSQLGGR